MRHRRVLAQSAGGGLVTTLELEALRWEARVADATAQQHFDRCRTRIRGNRCAACDELDAAANRAETIVRTAERGVAA